jgi:hypothetical protein
VASRLERLRKKGGENLLRNLERAWVDAGRGKPRP